MIVRQFELVDFRNYVQASLSLTDRITAVIGDNGQGKTNLVEAIGWMATMSSFRGAPNEALVRVGTDQAIVRAHVEHEDGRMLLIECEINRSGRNRVLVNKQRLQRSRDLLGVLRDDRGGRRDHGVGAVGQQAGPGGQGRGHRRVLGAVVAGEWSSSPRMPQPRGVCRRPSWLSARDRWGM